MPFQDVRSAWQPHMRVERDSETGVYRSTITLHDQNRLVSEQWASVVEDWANTTLVGFSDAATGLRRHLSYCGPDGQRRWCPRREFPEQYVEFGRPQRWTGSQWENVPLGGRVRQGNRVYWNRPNYAWEIVSTWNRLGLGIRLKNASAARRVRWPVSLHGLTWDNWRLYADATRVGAVIPPRIVNHAGVDPELGWDGRALQVSYSGGYVEFSADLSGLQYPIEIANTDVVIMADTNGKDTYTSPGNPDKHYGSDDVLRVAEEGSIILILFDLLGIDGDDTCTGATLSLWNGTTSASTKTSTFYPILVANDGWLVGAIADPGTGYATHAHHTEDTQEWAGGENGCFVSGSDRSAVSIGAVSHLNGYGVDTECQSALTAAIVETWFGDPNSNYGMAGDGTDTKPRWRGSHYATEAYRPKLVVVHEAGNGEVTREAIRFLRQGTRLGAQLGM